MLIGQDGPAAQTLIGPALGSLDTNIGFGSQAPVVQPSFTDDGTRQGRRRFENVPERPATPRLAGTESPIPPRR